MKTNKNRKAQDIADARKSLADSISRGDKASEMADREALKRMGVTVC